MVLYVAVTNDRYELPIAVAETQTELAIMVGGRYIDYMQTNKKESYGKKGMFPKKIRNEILQD